MKILHLKILAIVLLLQIPLLAQFGQNKVQYKDFTWYYIQTEHFDIYFSANGSNLAEFTAQAAEDALASIEKSFNHWINNRIIILVYNSTNDFQETNVTDEYLSEGIEGFTEIFKNRVVIQFMGSFPEFRHLIHHELTHAVMNDYFYGGSLQNIITNNISLNLPQWFNEGMAEYQSLGWDINTDMFIRDAIINNNLPDLQRLDGYVAYRGGESVFHYIASKYGKEKIGELVNKIKGTNSLEEGFKLSVGLSIKEFNERWKKYLKKVYWPDIALRRDPDEFAKRLTNPEEGDGFYNTGPTISPQGDRIAFISNRNYYFDVFIISAIDGKVIKRLVKGNRSPDFEQLNVVTPGLSWSPDESKIALTAKSDGNDIIYLIDVESEDKEILPVRLDGIKSLSWSPDGRYLAFIGHTAKQSDVFIYDLQAKHLINLTDDVFTDNEPSWSSDSKKIFFSSDRGNYLSASALPADFKIYNYLDSHSDIYSIDIKNKSIERITNMPNSNQFSPVAGPEGKQILFISDCNGINNIYKKRIVPDDKNSINDITKFQPVPVTNSLNGLYQISVSKDGKKLVFSSLYKGSYNLFLLNSPFDIKLDTNKLVPTVYVTSTNKNESMVEEVSDKAVHQVDSVQADTTDYNFLSSKDTTNLYGDSVQIDLNNYIFGNKSEIKVARTDTANPKFKLSDNLDSRGNYKVNQYKITFSPDIIYANAGYSSLYGLLGTTVLSFSDVLGNYRIVGQTSLQIDLKDSDYGLAYFYLKDRLNYGIETFHTARFVYLNRSDGANLFRFRNYGAVLSFSYPLNMFYRIETGLSWFNVTMENLDNPLDALQTASYVVPSISFIHDNSLFGYTAPIDGTRYRADFLANPGITGKNISFYSLTEDYRTYFRFFTDYSFAIRFSSGYSWGANPQRFFLGGVDNWINREFSNNSIPLNSPADFAFLSAALPLRGFDYAQEIGTKYGLLNMELRFPFIRYLVTGALPILFSNIIGVAFMDVGTAWNQNRELNLFTKNDNGAVVTNDLLAGTGFGARVYFIYFLLKFDVAWAYNLNSFTQPRYYISLGYDF
jgi:Tol biopolymer transport system component